MFPVGAEFGVHSSDQHVEMVGAVWHSHGALWETGLEKDVLNMLGEPGMKCGL